MATVAKAFAAAAGADFGFGFGSALLHLLSVLMSWVSHSFQVDAELCAGSSEKVPRLDRCDWPLNSSKD